jgi:hypothetical protein
MLTRKNLGKHRHEPIIARVLQEAARINNIDIIRLLLDDDVHPDVRVKMGDEAAIELAHKPEVRQLLYERGGKLPLPPDGCPLDWWGVGSQDYERQRPSNASLMGGKPYSGEFRGLIVDIFSPPPRQEKECPGNGDETAEQKNSPYDERHLICHPTVEEMIDTTGPGGIMDPLKSPPVEGCKRFRWIHLPMNHVSSASAVSAP